MRAQTLHNPRKPRMMEVQNQNADNDAKDQIGKDGWQMKKSIFRAVLVFAVFYIPLYFAGLLGRWDWLLLVSVGVGCGLLGAWVGKRLIRYKDKRDYGRDLAVFLGLYAAVLLTSVALFYTARGYGMDSAIFTIFYYFPQMLIVGFMIPAIVVYWVLLYVWCLWKTTAAPKNC